MTPLRYTLVPIIASVRWQMGGRSGSFVSAWQLGFIRQRISRCDSEGSGNTLLCVDHGHSTEFRPAQLEDRAVL